MTQLAIIIFVIVLALALTLLWIEQLQIKIYLSNNYYRLRWRKVFLIFISYASIIASAFYLLYLLLYKI